MNATFNQLISKPKFNKRTTRYKSTILEGRPQKKGTCTTQVTVMKPKKPNSGNRKVVKVSVKMFKQKAVNFKRNKEYLKRTFWAYLRGESPSVQLYSQLLVNGASIKDLVGIKHRAIRGAIDFAGVSERKNARSKYGTERESVRK